MKIDFYRMITLNKIQVILKLFTITVKKADQLVRDYMIRPNNQLQTPHQENSIALPSAGTLRKA